MHDWQGRMSAETTKPQMTEQNPSHLIFSSAVGVSGARLRLLWKPRVTRAARVFLFCLAMTKHIGPSILKHPTVFVLLYIISYVSVCRFKQNYLPLSLVLLVGPSCFFSSVTPSSFSSKGLRLNNCKRLLPSKIHQEKERKPLKNRLLFKT